jgi:hypothetical protein
LLESGLLDKEYGSRSRIEWENFGSACNCKDCGSLEGG